jgi:hypothetical protein
MTILVLFALVWFFNGRWTLENIAIALGVVLAEGALEQIVFRLLRRRRQNAPR